MSSISEMKRKRGLGGPPMLSGSDLPKAVDSLTVICEELREAPDNFSSPAIMDLSKEVYGKKAWAINITNLRKLAEKVGFAVPDDADLEDIAKKCRGKKFTLTVALVNNPKTKTMVRSLFVA